MVVDGIQHLINILGEQMGSRFMSEVALIEKESGGRVYQTKYLKKNFIRRLFINHYLMSLSKLLKVADGRDVLDVGCGEGFVLSYLAKHHSSTHLVGVDQDPTVLKVARYLNPSTPFIQAKGEKLPFSDQSFDVSLCNEVLEHTRDYSAILLELGRVAKYCILSVPLTPWYQIANLLAGANWFNMGEDPNHVVQWTKRRFREMLRKDFEIVAQIFPFPWQMMLVKSRVR